ncbi:MAG: ABC transporter ATP-binding protein [Alphaproteobacteria bacterium]|nr:ABC transporter ATP-binding protein [Alphaproteobacteria bacterium]MBU1562602.1 ABC transporter ATP-binding protein [Alphaproteobacteria bacterium]MBU2303244.1 ABC transporter ATP-binding protein [Alphaproteobacteria bacterium]MBU2370379.1 ABC transporter ATP-binding protein [Alphaproteobacteria bacterium]
MSSDDIAIRVKNVSKRYDLYAQPSDQLKQLVMPRLRKLVGLPPKQYFNEFWALDDVSFEIAKGEACGIVGRNGSGKSTLLQIITGTLSPTSGTVSTNGRIGALLELGSGFNPEFTGRENIYLNGAILGFSRGEMERRFDDIASFADIGDHLDQPVRAYSSGMVVRLAMAVQTQVDPDILIIDEALAVGDAYFQQKCFKRIEQFRSNGGTLLFVSHDANSVKQLCDTAILMSWGSLIDRGPPRDVIDRYNGLVAQLSDNSGSAVTIKQHDQISNAANIAIDGIWTKATSKVTNNQAELIDVKILDEMGAQITHIDSEQDLIFQYAVRILSDLDRPAFGIILRDKIGRSIFETSTYAMNLNVEPAKSGDTLLIRFRLLFNLAPGQYSFSVGVANRGFSQSDFEQQSLIMHDVEQIQVHAAKNAIHYGGVYNMRPLVNISVLEHSAGSEIFLKKENQN